MKPHIIEAALECDKDGTWYYVHVPKQIRDGYKSLEKREKKSSNLASN